VSYGRSPYYIIGTGKSVEFIAPAGSIDRGEFPYPYECMERQGAGDYKIYSVSIPYEALQQFVAQLASRGTGELQSWIDAGAALDDDYTGFYRNHESPIVRKEHKQNRKYLKTKVKVRRKTRKVR
jgi:hypothetical protein